MTLPRLALVLAGALGAGCADETSGSGNGDPADPAPACAAATSYASLPDPSAEQATDEDGETYLVLFAELSAGDELEVSLWNGAGAFASAPVAPGSYPISGDEAGYQDCGVCVSLYGDIDPTTMLERQLYHAQSGTVTIDSVSGTLAGSLGDIVLREVDASTYQPLAGGCKSRIASASFSAPIETAP